MTGPVPPGRTSQPGRPYRTPFIMRRQPFGAPFPPVLSYAANLLAGAAVAGAALLRGHHGSRPPLSQTVSAIPASSFPLTGCVLSR